MPPSLHPTLGHIDAVVRAVAGAGDRAVLIRDLARPGATTLIEVAERRDRLFYALEATAVAIKRHRPVCCAMDVEVRDRSSF